MAASLSQIQRKEKERERERVGEEVVGELFLIVYSCIFESDTTEGARERKGEG